MLEAGPPSGTFHQLGEKGRLLREVQHPLQAELLVAEIAGELPPEVAQAVREHIAACESCGARAQALAAPYGVLSSLGEVPVTFVPDLRRRVREQWSKGYFLTRLYRAARMVGGGGIAGVAALVAMALVVSLFLVTNAFQAPVIVGRSTNATGQVAAAGASGVVYVETNKVMNVNAGGANWVASEVIAVDERTGQVKHSMPASSGSLRLAQAGELPLAVALAPDGQLIYELTAPNSGRQALIAFGARTGRVAFATRITVSGGLAFPSGMVARGLTLSPDSARVYISLESAIPSVSAGPAILVLDQAGAHVLQVLSPALPAAVAEPPAPGGLPGVVTHQPVSMFQTDRLSQSLAAQGALAVAPDGLSLYDAVMLSDAQGPRAVIVQRISVATGKLEWALALPGDFSIATLAASANAKTPLFYLAQVGRDGQIYIFDTSAAAPTLRSEIPLGGPRAPATDVFSGALTISLTPDGAQAYVSEDVAVAGTQIASHDLWLVDGTTGSIVSHRIEYAQAGQALANWAGGAKGQVFVLRGSQVVLLPPDLAFASDPPVWLRLSDGLPMERLVATANG